MGICTYKWAKYRTGMQPNGLDDDRMRDGNHRRTGKTFSTKGCARTVTSGRTFSSALYIRSVAWMRPGGRTRPLRCFAIRGLSSASLALRHVDKHYGINAKESGQFSLVGLFEERRLPTLPPGRAVPSAMTGLASLFGMGRGGSPSL